jgi:hypothetical protein
MPPTVRCFRAGHSGVRPSCRSLSSDTRSPLTPQDEEVRPIPYQTIDLQVTLEVFLIEDRRARGDVRDDEDDDQPPRASYSSCVDI